MKKKLQCFASVMVALMLCVALAACGQENEEEEYLSQDVARSALAEAAISLSSASNVCVTENYDNKVTYYFAESGTGANRISSTGAHYVVYEEDMTAQVDTSNYVLPYQDGYMVYSWYRSENVNTKVVIEEEKGRGYFPKDEYDREILRVSEEMNMLDDYLQSTDTMFSGKKVVSGKSTRYEISAINGTGNDKVSLRATIEGGKLTSVIVVGKDYTSTYTVTYDYIITPPNDKDYPLREDW